MDKEEIKEIADATIHAVKIMLANEEIPELTAKFMKRYHDELMKAGFSRREALEILCKTEVPTGKVKTG